MPKNRDETRIYNKNKFKLGLFGMNCQGGLSLTKAPERWDASWDNNVKAAKLADEAGLEFLLPIGRWHGYQGKRYPGHDLRNIHLGVRTAGVDPRDHDVRHAACRLRQSGLCR